MDSETKINSFLLIEQLLMRSLEKEHFRYIPKEMNSDDKSFGDLAAIVNAALRLSEDITTDYESHIESATDFLQLSGKHMLYINLIGNYLFDKTGFSWNHLKMFLALVCSIAAVSFKKRFVLLADELTTFAAKYIDKKLQGRVLKFGGWVTFEKHCTNDVLVSNCSETKRMRKMKSKSCTVYQEANILEQNFDFEKEIIDSKCGSLPALSKLNNSMDGLDSFSFLPQTAGKKLLGKSINRLENEDEVLYVIILSVRVLQKIEIGTLV